MRRGDERIAQDDAPEAVNDEDAHGDSVDANELPPRAQALAHGFEGGDEPRIVLSDRREIEGALDKEPGVGLRQRVGFERNRVREFAQLLARGEEIDMRAEVGCAAMAKVCA